MTNASNFFYVICFFLVILCIGIEEDISHGFQCNSIYDWEHLGYEKLLCEDWPASCSVSPVSSLTTTTTCRPVETWCVYTVHSLHVNTLQSIISVLLHSAINVQNHEVTNQNWCEWKIEWCFNNDKPMQFDLVATYSSFMNCTVELNCLCCRSNW